MLQSPFAQTLFSGLSIYTWTGRTATVIYLCCDFNNNWSPKSPDVQKKLRWVLTSHNQGTSTLLLAQYVDEFAMFGLIATWFTEIRRWDWCECTLSKAALCNHLLQFTYIHQFFSAGMWAGCNMMGKLLCGRFGDDYFKLFNDAERRICLCSRLGASGKWEQQQLRLEMESANINLQRNTERPNVVFTRPKYFILKNGFTALSVYDSNKGGFYVKMTKMFLIHGRLPEWLRLTTGVWSFYTVALILWGSLGLMALLLVVWRWEGEAEQ